MYSRMHEKVAGSPRGRLSFEGLKSKKELRRLIFALFQEGNEHSIFSKCFKINEDGKQNYSSPPGEGVQTGKVRASPKIFCCGLFITEMTPPLKSLAQASCFLLTIPFPFRHWFKSYFPISVTTTPTFLIFHIQLRDSQTIIFYNISTNNLKSLDLCLFIIHLATNPDFVFSMTWNNRLVPNRKRSMSRLYTVTLLI